MATRDRRPDTDRFSLSRLLKGTALSILGVTGNAQANYADIVAGSDGQVLRRSGTALAFGALSLATAAAITGVLPTANGGTSVDIASAALPLGSGQITFPSSQNPSAGANTLDDYREGTWTPVIGGSGGTSGQTYSNQTGFYVKAGQMVIAAFDVTLTAKGTITTSVQIQGLPFTTAAAAVGDGIGGGNIQFWSNLAVAWITLNLVPVASSTAASLFGLTAAAVTTVAPTTADIANNTRLVGSVYYRASA